MRLLSDRIQEFIDWLEGYTDYGKDHIDVIHKKLIECMISDPPKEEKLIEGTRCTLCNGLGILEDPHHGHALRCHACAGEGYVYPKTDTQ